MNVDTWTRAQRATVAVLGLLIVAIPFVVWGLGSIAQISSRHECALVDARRVLLSEGTDFVFTSFRVGYVCAPPPAAAKIRSMKQALSICTAAPSQRAVLLSL